MEGSLSRFEWCPSVYTMTGSERKLISLAEMYDYVYLSGIQGSNMTDSTRLVAVNVTQLGKNNHLVSALSASSDVLAQQDGSDTDGMGEIPQGCYSIGMQMHQNAVRELEDEKVVVQQRMSRSGGDKTTPTRQDVGGEDSCRFSVFTMWPTKKYGTNYTAPFQQNAYLRRNDGMSEDESKTNETFVTVNSAHLGLYGAVRLSCTQGLSSGIRDKDVVGIIGSVAGLLVGVLLMVVVVTGLTYMLASTLFVGAAGLLEDELNAESYVERDFFGRGEMNINGHRGSGATDAGTETDDDYGDSDMDLGAIEGAAFEDPETDAPPIGAPPIARKSSAPPQ